MSESMRHPEDDLLQSLAAGALDQAEEALVRSHVVGCTRCTGELETWQALMASLNAMPAFEPSAHFADRVMARVDVQPMWAAVLVGLMSRLVPRSTTGWALVAAMFALPVLVYGGAAAWLASKPWFSTGWALTLAQETLVGGYLAGRDWLVARLADTTLAQWLAQSITSVDTSALGTAAVLFGTGVVVAVWVLYRNLIRTPKRERGHATFAF